MPFSKVERRVWNDETFRSWSRDGRDMWMYLLTCPHQNRLGCFVLDIRYAAADLQIEVEEAEQGLQEIEADDRIVYDPETRLVLVKRHLKYNGFENPNVAKGAVRDLEELPYHEEIYRELLAAVEKYGTPETSSGKEFYSVVSDAIRECLPDGGDNPSERVTETLPEGSGEGSGEPFANPEPEPEQEPEPEDNPGASLPNGRSAPSEHARERPEVRRFDDLIEFLGEHSDAALLFAEEVSTSGQWAQAILGQFVDGTQIQVWKGVDEEDWPSVLATALYRYAGEEEEYDNRLFAGYLKRAIFEQKKGDDRESSGRSSPKGASGNAEVKNPKVTPCEECGVPTVNVVCDKCRGDPSVQVAAADESESEARAVG